MLTSVALVCDQYLGVCTVEQETEMISRFLGPSITLSLSKACSFGSTKLLDWIWGNSDLFADARTSRWSLGNYLRSDPHYYRWAFETSMKEAAGCGELEILKWLLAHFMECQVPVSAMIEAAKAGHVPVVQFLWDGAFKSQNLNRQVLKKRKTIDRSGLHFQDSGGTKAADWANAVVQAATENQHFFIVRWILDKDILDHDSSQVEIAIKKALDAGESDLAKLLLPAGTNILDYARDCPHPKVIKWMLEDKRFRGDAGLALSAIKHSAAAGRLDLIHKIIQQLDTSLRCCDDGWYDAMKASCLCGDLSVVRWLAENQLGPEICDSFVLESSNELVEIGAENGHTDVVEYLCSYPLTESYHFAFEGAIRNNHLDTVKCLLKHISYTTTSPDCCVIELAAAYGRLGIVQYLHGLASLDEIDGYDETKVKIRLKDRWWSNTGVAMNRAAEEGHLSIVRWLHEHDSTRTANVLGDAVSNGHVELARWLLKHRPEPFTTSDADRAAAGGHLDMVKWLHTSGCGFFTTDAIDAAATNGHLEVVKWLCAHLREGYTVNALKGAVGNDHLHVACWVYRLEHARSFVLHSHAMWSQKIPRTFEMLLFMHAHLPWLLTPGVVRSIIENLTADDIHLRSWLTENYLKSA